MQVSTSLREFRLRQPFRISGKIFDRTQALIVSVERDGAKGRGEAEGVFYNGETAESIKAQADAYLAASVGELDRLALQDALPPGGARNAIDCALWDLEAKRTGRSIWVLTGIEPRALETVYTIGLEDEPAEMATRAAQASSAPVLKIKLNADRPVERIEAIRLVRPDATLVIDVNGAWSFPELAEYAPALSRLGVAMLEQPLMRGEDAELKGYICPIPLCADETCLHRGDLDDTAASYGMINIKLDKTGGLTEALDLARDARAAGMKVMVGNMLGSSLAMAPSFLVGCLSAFVDLDGPLLLAEDVETPMTYDGTTILAPGPALWG